MMKQFSYRHAKESQLMDHMEESDLFTFAEFKEEELDTAIIPIGRVRFRLFLRIGEQWFSWYF